MSQTTSALDHIPAIVRRDLSIFACPACQGSLQLTDESRPIRCVACSATYACDDGIPLLFAPSEPTAGIDVTDIVKAFYEDTPFPNYDDLDSPERLRAKASAGLFARLLDEEVPFGARVLECGCGTGQLTNFLGLTWGRTVFGTDVCLNSLRLGHSFLKAHDIPSATFVQMNLFRPAFRAGVFDIVITNGVLHHTADPLAGFRSILRTLKPGGLVVVGLYNTFGRIATDIRRLVFRLTRDRLQALDPQLRNTPLNTVRRRAWFRDQYKHPHESKHTLGEVLRWFDEAGVEFVNSVPKCLAAARFSPDEPLFAINPRGTASDRFVTQTSMLLRGAEGGLFIMIGRKKV